MTRGGLCVKLKDYEKRHYHPDRLLYPQVDGRRVGWEQALDTAAAGLRRAPAATTTPAA